MQLPELPNVRPLRREEYDRLVELGSFQNERLELLDGALVPMASISALHCAVVDALAELLMLALHGRARVRVQSPFAALDTSEPEPDVAGVPLGTYHRGHPDQAHLIAEVAESSLGLDRGSKLRIYARAGVPDYWIVNLPERCIEVYRAPELGSYSELARFELGQTLRLLRFPDVEVRVCDVIVDD